MDGSGAPKTEAVKALIGAKADVSQTCENFKMTPLHWAAVGGHKVRPYSHHIHTYSHDNPHRILAAFTLYSPLMGRRAPAQPSAPHLPSRTR